MHVAVAIVGFRNAQDVESCLLALGRSSYSRFEVVICENGGPEAYANLAATLPQTLPGGQAVRTVLAPRNLGYAGGVNRCMEESPEADAWWVLNPDTEPDSQALEAQVRRLERGDCDAVGGMVYLPSGQVQSYGGRWRAWAARAESIGYGRSLDQPVDAAEIEGQLSYLNGASMLVSRRFVDVAGPMREDYFLYCEEVEWCLRAKAKGLRLGYVDDAGVLHQQGTSTGNHGHLRRRSRTAVYLNTRNSLNVVRDTQPRLLPLAACALLLRLVARYARRGAWTQLSFAVEGWFAGIRNERGATA